MSQKRRPESFLGNRGKIRGARAPAQKLGDPKGTIKRLIGYLKPHQWRLLIVLVTAVLGTVFTIFGPKIMGKATTELFQGMIQKIKGAPEAGIDFGYILEILVVLAGLYLFSALFKYVQQYVMAGIAQKVVYALRKEVDSKLSRLPLQYFQSHPHGDLLSRVVNDLGTIGNTLQQSLIQLITSMITFIGIVVMMLTISPLMTVLVLFTLPVSFFVTKKIAAVSQQYFKKQKKALGVLNSHVEEMYTGHPVVKAFGRESESIATFDQINEKLYESGWKAQFITGTIMPLMRLINNIGYVLICVVGGVFVMKGIIHVGDIQAFIQYTRQFSQPITRVSNLSSILQSTIASAERVFEILDEPEEDSENATAKVLQSPKGDVRFKDVQFGYQDQAPIMKDINVCIQRGQTVAIVGPTGAGKTTLVNLLMRFYDLDNGEITIDGVDIREMPREHLHRLFGLVLQESWLFHGTIRDNIAYGRDDATEEEIVRAAKAAHADHFIRTLPEGYDTMLNEETSNISQGQKQLLSIARAILADPVILVLDEATSNVDPRTGALVHHAMSEMMEGRTSFIIAHTLSTIRNADTILVMNNGEIIEQGSHGELMEKGGFYADLYHSQFAGHRETGASMSKSIS